MTKNNSMRTRCPPPHRSFRCRRPPPPETPPRQRHCVPGPWDEQGGAPRRRTLRKATSHPSCQGGLFASGRYNQRHKRAAPAGPTAVARTRSCLPPAPAPSEAAAAEAASLLAKSRQCHHVVINGRFFALLWFGARHKKRNGQVFFNVGINNI